MRVSREKADGDIYGWGADIDVYLYSQDTDPNLNYQNSGITYKESKPGWIAVTHNAQPNFKDDKNIFNLSPSTYPS